MAEDEEPLYRELEHTADLGIEVEGETPAEAFRRAGVALFRLMVEPEGVEARDEIRVSVAARGWEELLHDWLARLLRAFLVDGFVAREVTVERIGPDGIDSRLRGEKLDWSRHGFLTEIKAVTWHRLAFARIGERWRATVIFDV